ncbi:thioredoxin-dependent thiol peroxidase [Galbitalea sp. SE-J8]|uniref:thioredoxin-dependent thiol peroxidase n=1 Tax=Galbitalea sp. SE-J8 TaxID=3054952 RepID=UPI00259CB253|nr:thioredoxin-dependent thiol peroxidase [Galbitalea sp. SE-J8]MDM4762691.1 thioredoxin-dependent thiol peroxidase [Galbitalea sp. SE-J8]
MPERTTPERTTPAPRRLEAGDPAPAFSLPDQHGAAVSLADYAGERVIVYFYPEALTPACTTQACDLRDDAGSLAASGFRILGISRDAPEKLARFDERHGLRFPLLSDPDLVAHRAYGAWGEKSSYGRLITGVLRSTFVVGEDGRIVFAGYNVKATGHIRMLRKRLGLT